MEHLEIDWNPKMFKVLGIWFTNDLQECEKRNYADKLAEIKHLFQIWSRRQLTPIGRVAILKSLILSKLIHLWMLLPNPPNDFFISLQNSIFKFVWSNKQDKIKRKTAHKQIKEGGLGIPEVKTLATALKLTWIRKLQITNHKWKNVMLLMYPEIVILDKCGPEILQGVSKFNKFWNEVFNAYNALFYKVKPKDIIDVLEEPLLYNNRIQIGNSFIQYKTWIEKGVSNIAHFLDQSGHFLSYDRFMEKYNIYIDFITFFGWKSAVRKYIKSTKLQVNTNITKSVTNCMNKIMSVFRGSKLYYDILIEDHIAPKCCAKWDEKLQTVIKWNKCFSQLHKIKDIKLKWFQVRIIHRCLGTNVVLNHMKIVDSNKCNFCKTTKDSIEHIFWDCEHTKTFWQHFECAVNDKCTIAVNMKLTKPLIILGLDNNNKIDPTFYFIILFAKYYIYQSKFEDRIPSFYTFVHKLKYRYCIDKFNAYSEANLSAFQFKWMH